MNPQKNFDLIIVGGGILGFSVGFQLLEKSPKLKILLIEKEAEAAFHQTGHNSGVIHAGVYYTPGSLKAEFCKQGCQEIKIFCQEKNIPYQETGKLIVATNALELERMQNLILRCEKNNLDFEVLDQKEIKKLEPNLIGIGAIYAKESGIVNWKKVTQKYAEIFKNKGGEVLFNQEVIEIKESPSDIKIKTKSRNKNHCEIYQADYLISCAGLYSDKVVKRSGLEPSFKIIPFRGEYYYLDPKKYSEKFKYLIYPVPDPNLPFLGVHFTPQISGITTVGPNAVLALSREAYSWKLKDLDLKECFEILGFMPTWKALFKNTQASWDELKSSICKNYYLKRVQKYYPDIQKQDLINHPAGVRAQAIDIKTGKLIEDFLFQKTERMLHTCNAPSPAATSSLPIGQYILNQSGLF